MSVVIILTSFTGAGLNANAATPETPVAEITLDGASASVGDGENGVSTKTVTTSGDAIVSEAEDYSISAGKVTSEELQLLITMQNQQAPTSYAFALQGAEGVEKIELAGKPLYRVFNAQNDAIAWVASPWAKTAQDMNVPTHYEISGNVLTQVIDTSGLSDEDFPVTADPYLGLALIDSVSYSVDLKRNSTNLKVAVSGWMVAQYVGYLYWNFTGGPSIAISYGWPEVLSKYTASYGIWLTNYITSKQTYNDQYRCHAVGAPLIFVSAFRDPSPTWDLEGFRASSSNLTTWISSNCNW